MTIMHSLFFKSIKFVLIGHREKIREYLGKYHFVELDAFSWSYIDPIEIGIRYNVTSSSAINLINLWTIHARDNRIFGMALL